MRSILSTVGGTVAFVCIVFAMFFLHAWKPAAFWVVVSLALLLVAAAFAFIHLQMKGHGAPDDDANPSLCASLALGILSLVAFIVALS